MPLNRLLYTSRSRLQDKATSISEQVKSIAEASAQRNKANGITGVLIHVDDHFIQVLEGEPTAVEETFERICCDFAHGQVKLIDMVAIKERLFDQWSMASLYADRDTAIAMQGDLQHVRFMAGVNARVAVEQMRDCLDRHAERMSGPLTVA